MNLSEPRAGRDVQSWRRLVSTLLISTNMAHAGAEDEAEPHQLVNVSEFIVEWVDQVEDVSPETVSRDNFIKLVSSKMNITPAMAKELDSVCE